MLNKLPFELRQEIFAKVPREDLYNILCSCRDLYNAAIPILYSHVDIIGCTIRFGNEFKDSQTIPGLMQKVVWSNKRFYSKYIRSIRVTYEGSGYKIRDSDEWDREKREDSLADQVQNLLKAVSGPIREFRFLPGIGTQSLDSLRLLSGRHSSSLTKLDISLGYIDGFDADAKNYIFRIPKQSFPVLREIRVPEVLDLGVFQLHYLLQACVALEGFSLCLCYRNGVLERALEVWKGWAKVVQDDERRDFEWLGQDTTWAELFCRMVFENLKPFKLKRLELRGFMDLEEEMAHCIQPDDLRFLSIQTLSFPSDFLWALQLQNLKLHTFIIGEEFVKQNLDNIINDIAPGLQELVLIRRANLSREGDGLKIIPSLPEEFTIKQSNSLRKLNMSLGLDEIELSFDSPRWALHDLGVPQSIIKFRSLTEISIPVFLSRIPNPDNLSTLVDIGLSTELILSTGTANQFNGLPHLRKIIFTMTLPSLRINARSIYLPLFDSPLSATYRIGPRRKKVTLDQIQVDIQIYSLERFLKAIVLSYWEWYSENFEGPPKLKWLVFDTRIQDYRRLGFLVEWNRGTNFSDKVEAYNPSVTYCSDFEKFLRRDNDELERFCRF